MGSRPEAKAEAFDTTTRRVLTRSEPGGEIVSTENARSADGSVVALVEATPSVPEMEATSSDENGLPQKLRPRTQLALGIGTSLSIAAGMSFLMLISQYSPSLFASSASSSSSSSTVPNPEIGQPLPVPSTSTSASSAVSEYVEPEPEPVLLATGKSEKPKRALVPALPITTKKKKTNKPFPFGHWERF
jgi:hypothetical protein